MRHKLQNMYEVGHRWAHPEANGDHAEAGNVSFSGNDFYSYRTVIASRHHTEHGVVGLFDDSFYSVSTRKHQACAWRCFSGFETFSVPDVRANTPKAHARNADYLMGLCMDAMRKIEERPQNADLQDLENVERLYARASAYANIFGLGDTSAPYSAAWLERMEHDIRSREMVRRASDRRREAEHDAATAKAARMAEIELELAEKAFERRRFWLRFIPWPSLGRRYVMISKAQLDSLKSRQHDRYAPTPPTRDRLSEWRRHEGSAYLSGIDNRTDAKLRLSQDKQTIETTGSARVPVSIAPKLWALVNGCRNLSKSWQHDPARSGFRLGTSYRLDSVSECGDIKVGCHGIRYAELRRMALELGLAKPTIGERLGFGGNAS